MTHLSVTIIAKNEEANIGPCLDSVAWADEIVVVDDRSDDRTLEICRRHPNVRILECEMKNGYGPQKNVALDAARGEWILSLDADERVTPELRKEIESRLGREAYCGYVFRWKSYALDRWVVDHAARNLRLFRKGKGRFTNKRVHEGVEMSEGEAGIMANPIVHASSMYASVGGYMEKQRRYSRLTAEDLYEMGRRVTPWNAPLLFVCRPLYIFLRKYLLWGRKYGLTGFLLSVLTAYDHILGYACLWEKQIQEQKKSPGNDAGENDTPP